MITTFHSTMQTSQSSPGYAGRMYGMQNRDANNNHTQAVSLISHWRRGYCRLPVQDHSNQATDWRRIPGGRRHSPPCCRQGQTKVSTSHSARRIPGGLTTRSFYLCQSGESVCDLHKSAVRCSRRSGIGNPAGAIIGWIHPGRSAIFNWGSSG